jgi:cytochrome oxidase Cu insertion factor (SCO1/SenC/PrrC family)
MTDGINNILALIVFGLVAVVMYAIYADDVEVVPKEKVPLEYNYVLTDHLGAQINKNAYLGRFRLVYFGYTGCDSPCQQNISKLSKVQDIVHDEFSNLQAIFISIDTKHDSPQKLKSFLQNYSPDMVALTGTPTELGKVVHIYDAKLNAQSYADDILLISPNGTPIHAFKPVYNAQQIADYLRTILKTK